MYAIKYFRQPHGFEFTVHVHKMPNKYKYTAVLTVLYLNGILIVMHTLTIALYISPELAPAC